MGFDGSGGYNRLHNWVTDKNASIKITASRMDAEMDDFASAMALCLLKDGQQLPTANLPMNSKKHTGVDGASARAEYVDLAGYVDGKFVFGGVASGTSAITVDLSPVVTAYTTGMRVGFIAVGDNASAVTLNVDGVSAAALIKGKNSPLVANDLLSGQAVWATYKGTLGWQISEQIGPDPTFVTLQTTGLATLNNVLVSGSAVFTSSINITGETNLGPEVDMPFIGGNVLAQHKNLVIIRPLVTTVDIDADDIILEDTSGRFFRASSVNLTADITTGTGINTLDTGSEASSTWYYLWVIYNGTTVASLLSESATAPTMPSGYTFKGLVGAVFNDSGSNFDDFTQRGDRVSILSTAVLSSGSSTTNASVDLSITMPPNANFIFIKYEVDESNADASSSATIFGDSSSVFTNARITNPGPTNGDQQMQVTNLVPVHVAQTIYYLVNASTSDLDIDVIGFKF